MNSATKITLLALVVPLLGIILGTTLSQPPLVINSGYTLGFILLALLLQKKLRLFPKSVYPLCIVFILLSVFAGRSFNLYGHIPGWDKLLHIFSGIIAVLTAKDLYFRLGGCRNKKLMYAFVLTFSIAVAGLWEVYEFIGDSLFGFNGQNGSLTDTMLDIICGSVGAAVTVFFNMLTSQRK